LFIGLLFSPYFNKVRFTYLLFIILTVMILYLHWLLKRNVMELNSVVTWYMS